MHVVRASSYSPSTIDWGEIEVADANAANLDLILYIKVPELEFENASAWASFVVANPWHAMLSQTTGCSCTKFFSIKSHQ